MGAHVCHKADAHDPQAVALLQCPCALHFERWPDRKQHCRIFERVDELMHTDPSELLSCHQQLLHEDFEALGEGSAGDRRTWIESMESALEAAEHYRSGREIMGSPGEVRRRRRVATPRRSPGGSFVYRLTSRG